MKSIIQKVSLFILLSMLTISVQAQSVPDSGTLGLRANITGQTNIEVPYMFNESFSLAPFFGLTTIQDQTTNFNLGVRPRYYLNSNNSLSDYATAAIGITNTSLNNTNTSVTDFNISVGYGGEYFFSNQFSISADVNLNSRFGNSANTLSTSARISASVYF